MITRIFSIFALLTILSGCLEGTDVGGPGLATSGNLSPEAIRLISQSETLISLEEEQRASSKRQQNFIVQGALLGVGGGFVLAELACNIRDCSDEERKRARVSGVVAGGAAGGVAGKKQADKQNLAAKAENEMKRRINLSSRQLTTARQARVQAQRVASANQRKLSKLRADVAAGRAEKQDLQLAQADARADMQQIQKASRAMNGSSKSLNQSGSGKNSTLSRRQSQIAAEQNATNEAYEALRDSIRRSAL